MNVAAAPREQALRELREHLNECDTKQDHAFLEALCRAIRLLELSDQEIADGLLVSRPTVNRWKNGKNLPHQALRKPILRWCSEQSARKVRLLERSAT
jgi:DNA-binding transcriptional regulator YiaG